MFQAGQISIKNLALRVYTLRRLCRSDIRMIYMFNGFSSMIWIIRISGLLKVFQNGKLCTSTSMVARFGFSSSQPFSNVVRLSKYIQITAHMDT